MTQKPTRTREYELDARAAAAPLGWRPQSPMPTMRQTRRMPSRVEHLQRRQQSITLRRSDHGDSTLWTVVENPTWMLTYSRTSGTYLAVLGGVVTVLGHGTSDVHFQSIRRIFLNMLPVTR